MGGSGKGMKRNGARKSKEREGKEERREEGKEVRDIFGEEKMQEAKKDVKKETGIRWGA